MNLPIISLVRVRQRRSNSALGHHGVRLAEQRFANQSHAHSSGRSFDRRAKASAPGANDQNLVLVRQVLRHQKILQSAQTPIEHIRT